MVSGGRAIPLAQHRTSYASTSTATFPRVRRHPKWSRFLHLNCPSCFGELNGLPALESTLKSRLDSAPEGSYTSRLFNDLDLLRSKIMEEADELCNAETREQVAFEANDLLYFTLTRCIAAGVSLVDIERNLDAKAREVSRRPGNAKAWWFSNTTSSAEPTPPVPATVSSNRNTICMCKYMASSLSPSECTQLLRRCSSLMP